MPTIAIFFGIVVRMYFLDVKHHNLPHIHVEYQSQTALLLIPTGELLAGELPPKQLVQVRAWIRERKEALMKNWNRAIAGEPLEQIPPLR